MSSSRRKRLRLQGYDYSENGAYFITICVHNKIHLFGEIINDKMQLNDIGKMVETQWSEMPERFKDIQLDEYIVMPNHFHGIIIIDTPFIDAAIEDSMTVHRKIDRAAVDSTIGNMVGAFKSIVTHAYMMGVKNKHWPAFDKKLWQRNYYEHVIRNDEVLHKIREYIMNNPINWHIDEMNILPEQRYAPLSLVLAQTGHPQGAPLQATRQMISAGLPERAKGFSPLRQDNKRR